MLVAAAAPPPRPSGLAHLEGPPPAHTGGFGEPTCVACHSELPLGPPGGELRVEGLPPAYLPGAAYDVTVRLMAEGTELAGFQGAFRFSEGADAGRSAGTVEALDEGVEVVTSEGGVAYVQHTERGTGAAGSGGASWTFRWTAPASPAPVLFHVAANSADGDASPFGDLVYAASVETRASQ